MNKKIPYELKIEDLTEKHVLLEETRRCLLNIYNTSIQTHAGYLIAVIIGALTLFSRWDSFFNVENRIVPIFMPAIFKGLIVLILGVMIWITLRIGYWTFYSSGVLSIRPSYIVKLFNKRNLDPDTKDPYDIEPPYLIALQWAIEENLEKAVKDRQLPWHQRQILNTRYPKRLSWLYLLFIGFFFLLYFINDLINLLSSLLM